MRTKGIIYRRKMKCKQMCVVQLFRLGIITENVVIEGVYTTDLDLILIAITKFPTNLKKS